MLVHYHSGHRLMEFELVVRFLDLHSVVSQLGSERCYLLLLLGDDCLQALNCAIERHLPRSAGNGWGSDVALGGKATRVVSIGGGRAQPSVGIDHHHSSRGR